MTAKVKVKRLALFSIIPGGILFFMSTLFMKEIIIITEPDSVSDPHHVDVYEKMAWIGLAEFGVFIGVTQLLFSGILVYLASLNTNAKALEYFEVIWLALNVIWMFALLTVFAFCFGYNVHWEDEGYGRTFMAFVFIDCYMAVAIIAAWFSIKPENESPVEVEEANKPDTKAENSDPDGDASN